MTNGHSGCGALCTRGPHTRYTLMTKRSSLTNSGRDAASNARTTGSAGSPPSGRSTPTYRLQPFQRRDPVRASRRRRRQHCRRAGRRRDRRSRSAVLGSRLHRRSCSFRSAARPRTSSSGRPPHRSFRRCGPLRADYTFGQALQGYSGAIVPARRRRRV